jgi:hypothetical protein
LTTALLTDQEDEAGNGTQPENSPEPELHTPVKDTGAVVTTSEELEAFYTVKALLYPDIELRRVFMRDVLSYCGVLLDDNNRKPICRLYLDGSRKSIGLFDRADRKEVRLSIENIDDIHQYANRLKATVARYEAGTSEK